LKKYHGLTRDIVGRMPLSGRVKVVTTNPGKWAEMSRALSNSGFEPIWIREHVKEIQSDDLTEIAAESGREAYARWGEGVLVEDAGLFILALNGFPGPYSSYAYSTLGLSGILKLMRGVEDRWAVFKSAVCYVGVGGENHIFTGEVHGVIADSPRGVSGFGFDPIFIPAEGDGRTFAEMSVEEKNTYSHRGRAIRRLIEYLSI